MRNEEDNSALDANLTKLIQQRNLPPTLSEEQKEAMLESLLAKQKEKSPPASSSKPFPIRRTFFVLGGIAAAIAIAFYARMNLNEPSMDDAPSVASDPEPEKGNPDPPIPPEAPKSIEYTTTERAERFTLRDGSIAIAENGTRFIETAPRQLELEIGSLYLIVEKNDKPLIVNTPTGEAQALGTRFLISTSTLGPKVAVAQGVVRLSNDAGAIDLARGQEGLIGKNGLPFRRPAPRVSHLVSWAREALKENERLPDRSKSGLVAIDPYGQSARLELRDYSLDIHIEDGVARTTIDQTFFNHYPSNTEGTFYFPLPPGATVSRMAMYVNGKRNEAGMVERHRGQQIYNDIKYANRDPALLEHLEGNLYKLRIFPLEGRQEKRIFISFTQPVDELYGNLQYRLPMDHTEANAGQFNIRARIKFGAELYDPKSSTHKFETEIDGDDLVLTYSAENTKPDQDLLLSLLPKDKIAKPVQTSKLVQGEHAFFHTRIRPEVGGAPEATPRQWFIINDSSASRSKADLAAQSHIIERLIAEGDDKDQIAILELNTLTRRVTDGLVPLRSVASRTALATTKQAEPLGATDIGKGISETLEWIESSHSSNPIILYIGDGMATDGTTTTSELTALLDEKIRFVGIAIGKKADLSFLRTAADATGGAAFLMNPDEDLNWRVFDMLASFNTPRLTNVTWELSGADDTLTYTDRSTVAAGEMLTVVCRVSKDNPPESMVLRGDLNGKPWEKEIDLTDARDEAGFVPRFWAQRHLEELLKDGEEHREEIVRLSMKHYVATPFTSLIVLESDKMYADYKVEKGRDDHWAPYPAPAEIPVVREPGGRYWWLSNAADDDSKLTTDPQSAEELMNTLLPIGSYHPSIDSSFYETDTRNTELYWGDLGGAGDFSSKFYGELYFDGYLPTIAAGELTGLQPPPINSPAKMMQNFTLTRLRGRGLSRSPITSGSIDGLLINARRFETGGRFGVGFGTDSGAGGAYYYNPSPSLSDLAVGLKTAPTDQRSIVELQFPQEKMGSIDADAAKLIRAAETKRIPQRVGGNTTTPDGRQKGTKSLPMYLEEEVVSDGETWWHVYREIGFAAQRKVTPSNLSAIRSAVPHWPPSLDEMKDSWKVTLLRSEAEHFEIALTDPDEPKTKLLLKIRHDGNLLESRLIEDGEEIARESFSYVEDTVTITNGEGDSHSYKSEKIDIEDGMFVVDLDGLVILDAPLRKPAFYEQQLNTTVDREEKTSLLRHLLAANMSDPRPPTGLRRYQHSNHLAQYKDQVGTLTHRFDKNLNSIATYESAPDTPCFNHLSEFSSLFTKRPSASEFDAFVEKWPDSPVTPYLLNASTHSWKPLLAAPSARYAASERIARHNSNSVESDTARKIVDFRIADAASGELPFVSKTIRNYLRKADVLDELVDAYRVWVKEDTSIEVLLPILDLGIQIGDDDPLRDTCLPLVLEKIQASKSWKDMATVGIVYAEHQYHTEACVYFEQAIALTKDPSSQLLELAAKSASRASDERYYQWEHASLLKLDQENHVVNSEQLRNRFDPLLSSAIKAGKIDLAIQISRDGEKIVPDSTFRFTGLSHHYAEAGQMEKSWQWLSSLLDRNPKNAEISAKVAGALRLQGKLAESVEMYAAAHSYDSADPKWLIAQTRALYDTGNFEDADELFSKLRATKWAPQLQRRVPKEINSYLLAPRTVGKIFRGKPEEGWNQPDFDDSEWEKNEGRFIRQQTEREIWEQPFAVRKRFHLNRMPRKLVFQGSIHGAACDIYLNGTLIHRMEENGWEENGVNKPTSHVLSDKELQLAVVGENVLAFKCRSIGKRPRLWVELYQSFK